MEMINSINPELYAPMGYLWNPGNVTPNGYPMTSPTQSNTQNWTAPPEISMVPGAPVAPFHYVSLL